MAGTGTYTAFNKERVGVYTNFQAKRASDFLSADTTGIVAIGLPMDFGEDGKVIELLGTELESGDCIKKIGYTLADTEILPYKLALTGAYKALLFKLNKGGSKAHKALGDIEITAKNSGILGDSIKVIITANTPTVGKFCIEVYFRDVKRETIYATTGAELIEKKSNYVVFSSTATTPTITAGEAKLEGGTNGSIVANTTTGTQATKTIGGLTFTAKIAGTDGNKIAITIAENTTDNTKYDLTIKVDGTAQETFDNLADATAFTGLTSNLVTITGSGTITTAADTLLTGGTDGDTSSYDDFFTAIKYKMYDYVAINSADVSVSDKVVEFVNKQITTKGKYVCGVVYNKPMLNNKYIISVDQGLECNDFTITTALMPVFIASLRAGCGLGDCLDNNNMTSLIGAHTIINPVDDDGDDAFITALKQGRFLFAYWNDGTVVVEEDLNTYVEYDENDPENYPADYRRNRLIATMNYIGNESQRRINVNVIDGKHSDDDAGNTRYLIKSIVDDVCSRLAESNVISSYDPQTDITVGSAGSSDRLYHITNLKYIDSIRQVYQQYNIVLS